MKCARCGKEQSDRSTSCQYCGNSLTDVEGARPTLVEFPAVQRARAGLNDRVTAAAARQAAASGDWKAELSERVRKVRERKNLQEARGRLHAEIEAAAQRLHQQQQPVERAVSEHHSNPIIEAALKRARKASEAAARGQHLHNVATAPKISPELQPQPKNRQILVPVQTPVVEPIKESKKEEIQPEPVKAELKPEPVKAETMKVVSSLDEKLPILRSTIPAAPSDTPQAIEASPLHEASSTTEEETSKQPVRVIKETDSFPDYLDELIKVSQESSVRKNADYSQRIIATILDLFVIALFTVPYWSVSYGLGVNLRDPRVLGLLSAATMVVVFIFLTLTTWASARTFGMIFVGTQVVCTTTGARPSLMQSILRSFGYLISVPTLGFALALVTRERRGLHDILSGTTVVKDY